MKKIFTILTLTFVLFCTSMTVNAQTYSNPVEAYNYCKLYVQEGNDAYAARDFENAQDSYEEALKCNLYCPDKKYMSDKKILRKIGDCRYAIAHNGRTRQDNNAEVVGAILGTALVVGAVATAASTTHHDVYEVHHHHHHHFPW